MSLDIEATDVANIDALADMTSLKRLNIAHTPITDVSPLKGLKLERITVTPETVTTGMEVLRDMPSLGQILTTMAGESRQTSAEFWQKYDAGIWKADSEDASKNESDKTPAEDETEPAKEENDKESPADSDTEATSQDEAKADEPTKSADQLTEKLPPSE